MSKRYFKIEIGILIWLVGFVFISIEMTNAQERSVLGKIEFEDLAGDVWVSEVPPSLLSLGPDAEVTVKVWFDRQLLGDGVAYRRRTNEFDLIPSSVLRLRCLKALKLESQRSFLKAGDSVELLQRQGVLSDVRRHWIVNGFSATICLSEIKKVEEIPGVKKIFVVRKVKTIKCENLVSRDRKTKPDTLFNPDRWLHPWYTRALKADRVWKKLGVSGEGTLNVIHDFHFAKSPQMAESQSAIVGFNFNNGTSQLSVRPEHGSSRDLHGLMCAAIVCGRGSPEFGYEFGLAPSGEWAGVIARGEIESSIEWAIENAADTYSMSFSLPGLGEYRSHWRKMLEHGTICGLCFVSGAGNFAKTVKTPLQMRTPEDIPQVVFAAAGVHRDLSKTSFSSQGPVLWRTEHYHEGEVQKPEVCAFNHRLPLFFPDGKIRESAINGNSFAGPMFCGSIALMRSADKEIHPWRIREIITSTATDIEAPGFDSSTGHGLINCYQAVKEVLKRKAIREGSDLTRFEEISADDLFDPDKYRTKLSTTLVVENSSRETEGLEKTNLQAGDIITAVNGKKVATAAAWEKVISQTQRNLVDLQIIRERKPIQIHGSSGRLRDHKVKEVYGEPVFK